MEYANMAAASAAELSRAHVAPVIVVGSSEAACLRGGAQVAAAGLRLAAAIPVADALVRLDQQAQASAVWVEIDRDDGASLDRLLNRVDRDADAGRYGAVIATTADLLDPVAARLSSSQVEMLVDETDSGRVAALALATQATERSRVSDVTGENSAARLRQLSDEVGRIAATLARLSTGPESAKPALPLATTPTLPSGPAAELSRETVRAVIRARRLRTRFFAEDLFADPAWDMLLDLIQAEIAQIRVPVSSLCIAAAVPATTALRWIKTLTDTGIFLRRADPHDGRRVFVELAPATSQAMRHYFGEVGRVAGA